MKGKYLVVMLVCVAVFLLSNVEANAMPEFTTGLAQEYVYCRMYDNVSNLTEYFKSVLDRLYAGEGGEGTYDPDVYDNYIRGMGKSISEMNSRKPYTQEQAMNEIGRMIDSGKFPANYIFAKGQYKYTAGINAVVTTTDVNLRSQPNANAIKLSVVDGLQSYPYLNICNYMGEWTNPQGERWVLVSYDGYDKGKLTGWLSGKYTKFITDAQIMEIARAYENALATPRTTAKNEYGRQEESTYTTNSPSYSSGGYAEEVSAETLLRAWAQNPLRAERTYKGKTLKITGKVNAIATEKGSYYVEFKGWFGDLSKLAYARCFVSRNDPLLSEIDAGSYITIRGYVSDVDSNREWQAYTLTNCQIISAR